MHSVQQVSARQVWGFAAVAVLATVAIWLSLVPLSLGRNGHGRSCKPSIAFNLDKPQLNPIISGWEEPTLLSDDSSHASTSVQSSTLPTNVSNSVVVFALISRNNAGVLPYTLNNIKRLAAEFAKAYVIMVENDSEDNTVAVFLWWLRSVQSQGLPIQGEVRTHQRHAAKPRDLRLYAAARNQYLYALREPRYADADFLIVVDTDMCLPWKTSVMARVISALMLPQNEDDSGSYEVVYAYGACGWYSQQMRNSTKLYPYTPGAYAHYCDLFALQAVSGERFVVNRKGRYIRLQKGWLEQVWDYNDGAMCSSNDCLLVNGEPVMPVKAAFGGLAVYRASLFRHAVRPQHGRKVALNNTPAFCEYSSDTKAEECEHIPLGNCLYERGFAQAVAKNLVISWEKEGCRGPVVDEFVPPTGKSAWHSVRQIT